MVEFVSWFGVAVIALFAVVGLVGVLATSALTVVRRIRHHGPTRRAEAFEHVSPAA